MNQLNQALLENEVALLENKTAVKELNGTMNVQSFTSSSWQMFRQAMFSGEGNLLPRYNLPGSKEFMMPNTTSAAGTRMPSISGTQAAGTNGDSISVDIHEVKERADPLEIAKTIGFKKSTVVR
jgi:hypothetical protein